jgi:hypothetical protein
MEMAIDYYQTVTLVTDDGRKLTFTGRDCEIDLNNPPRIIDVYFSRPIPLPPDYHFETLPRGDRK